MANKKNYVTEQEADLLESALRLAIGNVEGFDGAPYIKKIADELDKQGIPYNLDKTGEQLQYPPPQSAWEYVLARTNALCGCCHTGHP